MGDKGKLKENTRQKWHRMGFRNSTKLLLHILSETRSIPNFAVNSKAETNIKEWKYHQQKQGIMTFAIISK